MEADGDLVFYPSHIPYYLGEDNTPKVYSAVRLILDMDYKKHIGILKIDSKLFNLEQLTDNHIVIAGKTGKMIAGSQKVSHRPAGSPIIIDGEWFYATVLPIARTDWQLIYLTSLHSGSRRIFISVLISAFCMAVGIGIAFVIYNITDTIRQFEQGNLKARSTVSADNELKIISDELNTMADNMEAYIAKEYIAVINRQKAEYKALQSQINPHFLYNTLNGFIALNRMGEKKILYDLTPNYLSSLFHQQECCKLIDYITEVRLNNAKRILIKNTSASVKDVAVMVGYTSARHFSTIFQKATGITPSTYRKEA